MIHTFDISFPFFLGGGEDLIISFNLKNPSLTSNPEWKNREILIRNSSSFQFTNETMRGENFAALLSVLQLSNEMKPIWHLLQYWAFACVPRTIKTLACRMPRRTPLFKSESASRLHRWILHTNLDSCEACISRICGLCVTQVDLAEIWRQNLPGFFPS